MAKPWVLLDCDGVLLDWDAGIRNFVEQHRPHLGDPGNFDEHSYDLTGRMDITREEANQLVWDFHHSEDYLQLQPMPGAVKAIQELSKFCNLVVITACGTDPHVVEARKQGLNQVFGDVFFAVHCTDGFEEKKHYLQQYDPGYWIEDHAKNALMGKLYGHQSFLIDAPYNQDETVRGVQRVSNVLEAAQIILGILRARFQRWNQN